MRLVLMAKITHLHRPSLIYIYWTSTNDLAAIEVDIVDLIIMACFKPLKMTILCCFKYLFTDLSGFRLLDPIRTAKNWGSPDIWQVCPPADCGCL